MQFSWYSLETLPGFISKLHVFFFLFNRLISVMQASSQKLEMVSKKPKKLLKIDPDVHDALGEVGEWGETYSDIIRKLVKFYKEHGQKK